MKEEIEEKQENVSHMVEEENEKEPSEQGLNMRTEAKPEAEQEKQR